MGWLYLCLSLITLALAAAAAWPPRTGPIRSLLFFFVAWPVRELAPHLLAGSIVVTLAAWLLGGLEGDAGHVGLLCSAAAWFLFGAFWRSAADAAPAMDAALRDALGEGWRERLPDAVRTGPEPYDSGRLLRPFAPARPGVDVERGVAFVRARGLSLKLDVYRPAHGGERLPVLLVVHGGGWVIGSKRHQGLQLSWLMASRGWLVVNVNYRLSPHATFPEPLVDLKHALRWIRSDEGLRRGADPDFVVAYGLSAGAHLAAWLALTPNEPRFQPGFEGVDTALQGCVGLYGVYDLVECQPRWPHDGLDRLMERHVIKGSREELPEIWAGASPKRLIREDAPPFLLVHGSDDTLVPLAESAEFAAALRAVSRQPVAYAAIPGAEHAFDVFTSPRSAAVTARVADFYDLLRADHLRALEAPDGPQDDAGAGEGAEPDGGSEAPPQQQVSSG